MPPWNAPGFPRALHFVPDDRRPAGRLPLTLALWALASALVVALTARPTSPTVLEDECYWIGSAYYFDLAWRQRDWNHPDWQLLPARENPPLAKYVIGASLAVGGERLATPDILGAFYLMFSRFPGAWGEGEDFRKRAAVVGRMSESLRAQASAAQELRLDSSLYIPPRLAMLGCTLLASLLLLLLARTAVPDPAALAASQLTLLHPVATAAMNNAMAEAVLLLFSVAAAWAVLALLRALADPTSSPRLPVVRILAAGTLLGLACAAKMNALTVVPPAVAGLVWLAGTALLARQGARAGIILAGGLAATGREHRLTAEIQTRLEGVRLDSAALRIGKLSTLFFLHPWAWLALAAPAVTCLASRRLSARFAGAWWLLAWIAVVAWLPLSRLRYTAPLLLPSALVAALTLDALQRRFRPARPLPAPVASAS